MENLVFTPERRLQVEEFLQEESYGFQMGVVIHPQSHWATALLPLRLSLFTPKQKAWHDLQKQLFLPEL